MIRRQSVSTGYGTGFKSRDYKANHVDRLSYRQARTHRGSDLFQPTIFYQDKFKTMHNEWIGKILIPWNGENIHHYLRQKELGLNDPRFISEYEIANYFRPLEYRILYAVFENGELKVKSRPSKYYVPARPNLILTTDNKIQDIIYF